MVPGAFGYKQTQQPTSSPSYPTGQVAAQANFRPPVQSQSALTQGNPYANNQALKQVIGNAAKPSATAATSPSATASVSSNAKGTDTANVPNMPSNYNQGVTWQNYASNPIFPLLTSLGGYIAPMAGQQAQFAGQLEPQREQSIQNYLNYANPASQQAQVNTYGNQAMQNANVGAQESGAMQKAAGLGTGYQAGNLQEAGQAAAGAKNQYQQQVMSPQYQQQLLQGLSSAFGQGQSLSGLNTLNGLNNSIVQQEQVNQAGRQQQGGSILGSLGGIAGSIFGGPLGGQIGSSLFGGGNSMSSYNNAQGSLSNLGLSGDSNDYSGLGGLGSLPWG